MPTSLFADGNPIAQALDEFLDSDLKVFFTGAAVPTESELADFEAYVGYRLPEQFRELHKTKYGSFYVEVKESVWPRHKAYDVGEYWSFLYGFYISTLSSDAPDWMSIRKETEKFRKEWGTDLTPFLKIVGDVDVYCFDRTGKIVRWDHEAATASPIEMSFVEVVRSELKDLAERKERKKARKEAQPGATDNPDDAQRLREDH